MAIRVLVAPNVFRSGDLEIQFVIMFFAVCACDGGRTCEPIKKFFHFFAFAPNRCADSEQPVSTVDVEVFLFVSSFFRVFRSQIKLIF